MLLSRLLQLRTIVCSCVSCVLLTRDISYMSNASSCSCCVTDPSPQERAMNPPPQLFQVVRRLCQSKAKGERDAAAHLSQRQQMPTSGTQEL